MRKRISSVLPYLLLFLLLAAVFALGFILVGGLAIGLGHLLMRFFPLTLFEATVLTMLFGTITAYILAHAIAALIPPDLAARPAGRPDNTGDIWTDEYEQIPTLRFYASASDRTWENWLRKEIANDIFAAFQYEPTAVAHLDSEQLQERAIALSDVALSILKRKRGTQGRLRTSMPTLKRALSKMGQQSYDDPSMRQALEAINMNLEYYEADLKEVIRRQAWDEIADIGEI